MGAFVMNPNGDLVCIKMGPHTGTGKTEVHVLSAASNYRRFVLQTRTALHYTHGANWAFVMNPNGDLVCIKKGPHTGTGKTEVHVLSAASNYGRFVLQTGTALHYTHGANWAFVMNGNGDLVSIKKAHTGTGMTEVHVLSAASNYQTFVLQT